QRKISWVSLKLPFWAWDTPLFATLAPGEVRKVTPSESWMGTPTWIGRSDCGTQFYQTFGAVQFSPGRQSGPPIAEDKIIAHVREVLARKVIEAASKPKHPRSSPKPTGVAERTLEARRAVREQQPAVVRDRLAHCQSCKRKVVVPATEEN